MSADVNPAPLLTLVVDANVIVIEPPVVGAADRDRRGLRVEDVWFRRNVRGARFMLGFWVQQGENAMMQ